MGNSASSLPYSIGKQVSFINHGWALHEGTQKSDGASVSVFVAKKPALNKTPVDRSRNPSVMQLGPALHHFMHCKKLRHPHILKVYATLDTDHPNESSGVAGSGTGAGAAATNAASSSGKSAGSETGDLIIVTEPCMTLDAWLQTHQPPPEVLAWGLESIVRALSFLHGSAHLAHANVSPESFLVTPAGDVKLWNFSLVTSIEPNNIGLNRQFLDWEALLTPTPYRSPERIEGRWEAIAASPVHVMDSYSVGVIASHLFHNQLPPALVKAVQRMQTPNLKMRPRLQPLLKCPIFDTPYQKLQLQLEEFTVQPVEQKISFWQTVTPQMTVGLIPRDVSLYKLLPLIKTSAMTIAQSDSLKAQDMYRRELASMLPPMFYIVENYLQEPDDFRREIRPVAILLFTVTDRGIRGALLQKVALFAKYMDKHDLNTAVFEPMCSGFSDSSAALRELTLKATLVLVPHLTHPNLEKLSRYLIRLQSDPEPSIRTNTVIFFSKLAPHLTEMSRQKQLLPAFTRAMRDTFPACRLSALKSVKLVKEFFTPEELANTVIPAVSPHLLDAVVDVRREAFLVMDDFLATVRQESQRLASLPTANAAPGAAVPAGTAAVAPSVTNTRSAAAPAPTGPSQPVPAPSSGGYLSGISSWMASSTAASPAPAPSSVPPAVSATVAPPAQVTAPIPAASMTMNTTTLASLNMSDDLDLSGAGGSDGWGDEDDDNSETVGNSNSNLFPSPIPTRPAGGAGIGALGGTPAANRVPLGGSSLLAPVSDDDNFFGEFEAKAAKPVISRPKPAGGVAAKGKLVVPGKKTTTAAAPKPVVKKLEVKDNVDDGWDDF